MLEIKRVLDAASVPITVYAGREWPTYFGDDFTAFSQSPLICKQPSIHAQAIHR